jgi:squalene-associated FAD-dependent desaturase
MTGRSRVAVVGGGLAGIAAAIACADGGADVTLFEAKRWLGGATASFEREGMTLDTGQHVFLRCCTAYRGLLDRLGVTAKTDLQPRLSIPVLAPGGRSALLRRGRLPAPLHLGAALARYPYLGTADRLRAARASFALRRLDPGDPRTDTRTFGAWLRAHGQSEASVRYLWDLFGLPALNLPAGEASLALAAKVFRTGLLERRDAADIGIPLVSLRELHGEPALAVLGRLGVDVQLGGRIRQVVAESGGVSGVLTDQGGVDVDAVIAAVPNERAGDVLPEGALADPTAPGRLGSSPIVNVHVVYGRAVTDLPFAAVVDSPVQWVFDRTRPAGLDAGQYLAISLSGADGFVDRTVEDLRAEFAPALEAVFPAARGVPIERFVVTRERAATFRQAPGTAGLRPGPRTRIPRLFVAGAWTDTGWPATMEGAVRSGLAAARHALVALGQTGPLPAEVAA